MSYLDVSPSLQKARLVANDCVMQQAWLGCNTIGFIDNRYVTSSVSAALPKAYAYA